MPPSRNNVNEPLPLDGDDHFPEGASLNHVVSFSDFPGRKHAFVEKRPQLSRFNEFSCPGQDLPLMRPAFAGENGKQSKYT